MMTKFQPGQKIAIECTASEGAFQGEFLVSFDTKTGPVSGFVEENHMKFENGRSFIIGEVKDVSEEELKVLFLGSFFTTTGLAYFSPDAPIHQMAA